MVEQAEIVEYEEPDVEEVEVEESPSKLNEKLQELLDAAKEGENLCDYISEGELPGIKTRVADGYQMDKQTMDKYLKRYDKVLDLATMDDCEGDKTFPFVGASKVMMPYLAQAALDFNSRTVPEVVNKKNIAKVGIWGRPTEEKEDRAERVASAINWQLKRGIQGWGKKQDHALLISPLVGMYFKKTHFCNTERRIKQEVIPSKDLIYDHEADSFEDAPRKSFLFEIDYNDYKSKVIQGVYKSCDSLEKRVAPDGQPEIQENIQLVESHCTLDLDGDDYCEPYIVTWCEEYSEILRIEPRFDALDVKTTDEGEIYDIDGEEFFTQTGFIPNPKKPAVYDGWGEMLYDIYESLNTFMRQLLDAGTLNNIAGSSGFIDSSVQQPGKGSRVKSGKFQLIQGQLTKVQVGAGKSLAQSIFTMPFREPSQGLFTLLQNLKDEVRILTTASQNVDVSAGEAASLYLARLQQALKVPNAIMSRVYQGLGDEFNRIYVLIARYMSDEEYREIIDWEPEIDEETQMMYEQATVMAQQTGAPPPLDPPSLALEGVTVEEDFDEDPDIIPTADPNLGSDMERVARAEAVYQASLNDPGINSYEARKSWLESMNTPNVEQLNPMPSNEPSPQDIMNAQYMQSETESNMADSQSKMARARLEEMKVMIELQKLEPEIDKIVSETLKNLSDADKNEANTIYDQLDARREDLKLMLGAKDAQNRQAGQTDTAI